MAVLPESDRLRVWRGVMRWWSSTADSLANLTKADIKAAVDAADSWVDSNAASYNSALPANFRNRATQGQKSILLVAVILMRYNLDLLRRVFGEVE